MLSHGVTPCVCYLPCGDYIITHASGPSKPARSSDGAGSGRGGSGLAFSPSVNVDLWACWRAPVVKGPVLRVVALVSWRGGAAVVGWLISRPRGAGFRVRRERPRA